MRYNFIQDMVEKESCANCAYYTQHHIYTCGHYRPCFVGHCSFKRLKKVKPSGLCEGFTGKEEKTK